MNTIQLQQWQDEFCVIMEGSAPDTLKMDELVLLHERMTADGSDYEIQDEYVEEEELLK